MDSHHTLTSRVRRGFLPRRATGIVGMAMLLAAATAVRSDWLPTAGGIYDYLETGNWLGGTIDGVFPSTLTFGGAQTATFGADHTAAGGLDIQYAGAYNLTLRATGGARTLTLGGDVNVAPAANQTVTIGSTTASENLHVDLGGATRTFTVATGRTLTLQNTMSNGGVAFGGGTLVLSSVNTYAGGTTINGGKLVANANTATTLGDASGSIVFNGGTLRLGSAGSGGFTVPHSMEIGAAGATMRGYQSKGVFTLNGPMTGSGQLSLIESEGWDTPSFILTGDIDGSMKLRAEDPVMLSGDNTFTGGILFKSGLRFSSQENLGGPNSALTTLQYNAGPITVMGSDVSNLSGHTFSFASNTGVRFEIQDPDNVFTWDKNYNSSVNGASEPTFGKEGLGTMIVTVGQTYGNSDGNNKVVTRVSGGVLKIDYETGGSLKNTQNNLGFASGTLYLLGKTDADTTQTFQKVKLETGGGALVADNNSGTGAMLVNLGGFAALAAPASGSSLNVSAANPGAGSVAVTTTQTNDASGILVGGRIVFNGADWASVVSGTTIGAYGGYSVGLPSSGADGAVNYSHAGNATVTASESVNTLKLVTTAGGQSLAVDEGQILTAGALLFAGADDYAIAGGALAGSLAVGGSADLLLHHYGTGKLTIGSVITNGLGTSTLTIVGPGTTELTAANRYTGATRISGGTLILSNNNQLNNGANTALGLYNATLRTTETISTGRAVSLSGGGATFDIADGKTLTISGAVTGGRLIIENSDAGNGTLVLSSANTFGGGIEINGGILKLGHNSALHANGYNTLEFGTAATQTLQINGARTVTVAGLKSDSTAALVENGASGAAVLTVNTGANNTFQGTLQDGAAGTLGLTKGGGLTLTLTAANTYTGPTTVLGGTLAVNGSLAAASTVTVTRGALGGTGTVAGPVTVEEGGALAPGSSVGTLATGALTLNPGAVLDFELGSTANADHVNVTGDLTLDGVLEVTDLTGFGAGQYTLITYTGTLTDNGLDIGQVPDLGIFYTIKTNTPGSVILSAAAPGTVLLVR